jgi:hypothetical protein
MVYLKSLGRKLEKLYIRVLNTDLSNLRILEFKGKRIPYVLVNNDEILNLGGTYYKNLFFVAKDRFPERWQQDIVAYHEFFDYAGHEYAKTKEFELAKYMDKEKEWLRIRNEIDEEAKLRKNNYRG